MVRRADVVAAVSEDVAAECREVLGVRRDRLVVVPNGRDPATFHPMPHRRLSAEPPVVLFVGAMVPGKRPDRFVRVVDELRSRGFEVRAQAIGDGPMRRVIEDAARRAGVELPGPSADVADVMRRADLLVFPSAPEGEGMPGVLIEAGLSGLASVATDVAGVRDVVADGRTGTVVPVEDLRALVDATAGLVADRDRRQSMGAAARARCNELFSLRASAARWRELLAGLPPAR
jgi:glycosyltransferase involved in cell wall biosynthesis